ncbi:hypothetical protein F4780DRAFT_307750 [Xylariomycetidae sp. FL0641]|nr:hypothetical protein F4780DRAFT_307750 [Xylariomycetidae sp. FL0641]
MADQEKAKAALELDHLKNESTPAPRQRPERVPRPRPRRRHRRRAPHDPAPEGLRAHPQAARPGPSPLSTALLRQGLARLPVRVTPPSPLFRPRFAQQLAADGSYQVTAPWPSGLSDGAHVGGLLASGWLAG